MLSSIVGHTFTHLFDNDAYNLAGFGMATDSGSRSLYNVCSKSIQTFSLVNFVCREVINAFNSEVIMWEYNLSSPIRPHGPIDSLISAKQ